MENSNLLKEAIKAKEIEQKPTKEQEQAKQKEQGTGLLFSSSSSSSSLSNSTSTTSSSSSSSTTTITNSTDTKSTEVKVSKEEANKFLKLVMEGGVDEAEAMLKETPALALAYGDEKDFAGRTFTEITGFQYALWIQNSDMYTMILKYLPEDAAKKQAEVGLSTGYWVKEHGTSFGLPTLVWEYPKQLNPSSNYRNTTVMPKHFVKKDFEKYNEFEGECVSISKHFVRYTREICSWNNNPFFPRSLDATPVTKREELLKKLKVNVDKEYFPVLKSTFKF